MEAFVRSGSIVQRIWGDADVVLLIFAGAAAEFALNRAVDWLFVTRELPRDPMRRLFSTAAYAQDIAFADVETATATFARIRAAHAAVERQRGTSIPDRAHRDVLYLLVDYSERSFCALYRPLIAREQAELWEAFLRVGEGLGIPELPGDYQSWQADRDRHLAANLRFSNYTATLYATYRRQLGPGRYLLLRQVQSALVPERVRRLLGLNSGTWMRCLLRLYPVFTRLGLRPFIQRTLIPPRYLGAVHRLDQPVGLQSQATF